MDEEYMRQALFLAQYATGRTSPNPMVGAVIVREGRVVGQGWHKQAGTPHAEINALQQAGELAEGATIYVTLEPCSHHGRTGPCADALILAGITRVIVAMADPNPLVAGQGINKLRKAGIEVVEGVLSREAAKLNEVFIKWISTKLPFVHLKSAMSLDGKIASYTGQSQWITGPAARNRVHTLRDTCDAILVGIGTVLADNPSLTTRLSYQGKNPNRVIVDSMARTPLTANVVTDGLAKTIIAVTDKAPEERVNALRACGVEVLVVESKQDGVNLPLLFKELGKRQITSLLIEGGASINASVLEDNLVDKVHWFIAPKIIGGNSAPGPIAGQGIADVNKAILLEDIETESVGEDILISAYMRNREGRDVYRTCGRIR
ncbi:bifunctional diaminohydroxyphosphoribosylaminopyrimidine deaminase/5-amino-6-(5-phosphoribosylamino)uracil reductase RibD [Pelosinus sp. IPA-1]|uniref:bifunctional diaminohydroxyphosphoribosylaminopyrimidine deaminase/5-amino-6-(5-phosphoribosylamino)uracil reductase RibD n=1 Tax=Pelosinus sp. IPA-1 TaxID=3029569 RepID=UPI0024362326|nr:bifunctional diaminohydroxyphosphoribosylaminopyrimidine deaminase/5-amino-6-(5-phosphoribosylamino)uracil reductase RibD [Pelosinus sp. IPA-1]GMA99635.1 riboflavin biosynthesis protein RibD [Pelosinus sp. IPA-1]